MDTYLERRVNVSTCWASTRLALLDSIERYEDSYAITQEFKEWILTIGENPEILEDSVLKVPNEFNSCFIDQQSDIDEALEI